MINSFECYFIILMELKMHLFSCFMFDVFNFDTSHRQMVKSRAFK